MIVRQDAIKKVDKTTILFFPTLDCNLRCSYCNYYSNQNSFCPDKGKARAIKPVRHWFEWITFFEQYRPYHLEFSGGEPLLYRDFAKLIAHITYTSTWAITSNGLLDIPDGLDLSKCISWTNSFHEYTGDRLDTFERNLEMLTNSGCKPSVTIVATPNNLKEKEIKYFTEQKYRVNLLRVIAKDVDWDTEHKAQWEKLQNIVSANHRVMLVIDQTTFDSYNFRTWDMCEAGITYFMASADGTIYRCYSDFIRDKPKGQMFETTLNKKAEPCKELCFSCGKDQEQKKYNLRRIIMPEELYGPVTGDEVFHPTPIDPIDLCVSRPKPMGKE